LKASNQFWAHVSVYKNKAKIKSFEDIIKIEKENEEFRKETMKKFCNENKFHQRI
jgi:hypothetical protein